MQTQKTVADNLRNKILAREAAIGVIGLGYVGLPLCVEFAREGFPVVGLDVDPVRVASVTLGDPYISDVAAADLRRLTAAGRLRATDDYDALRTLDVAVICVQTPFTATKEPDLRYVIGALQEIARRLRPGQLIVLQSTTYPGTTEEVALPILATSGLEVGRDFFLAFSPERVDPGNTRYTTRDIPKVVGGITPTCTQLASALFAQIVSSVHPVDSTRVAEMTKLLENVYRSVNIALVNELTMLCERMGIDVWQVVEAAATKPFGFMPFSPGPGVGGHCIPVDPYYLAWKAKEYDFHMDLIELAARVNDDMPYYVSTKILLALNGEHHGAAPRILILGVTFKRDIADYRHSPALKLMEILRKEGAMISYHDPHVPALEFEGGPLQSVALTPQTLADADCVVIATDHTSLDYRWVVRHARKIFDTRNAAAQVNEGREKILRI